MLVVHANTTTRASSDENKKRDGVDTEPRTALEAKKKSRKRRKEKEEKE
jgi:hypothetical protein